MDDFVEKKYIDDDDDDCVVHHTPWRWSSHRRAPTTVAASCNNFTTATVRPLAPPNTVITYLLLANEACNGREKYSNRRRSLEFWQRWFDEWRWRWRWRMISYHRTISILILYYCPNDLGFVARQSYNFAWQR